VNDVDIMSHGLSNGIGMSCIQADTYRRIEVLNDVSISSLQLNIIELLPCLNFISLSLLLCDGVIKFKTVQVSLKLLYISFRIWLD
jgi:hypothetical protein